jgi:hypothetical protein
MKRGVAFFGCLYQKASARRNDDRMFTVGGTQFKQNALHVSLYGWLCYGALRRLRCGIPQAISVIAGSSWLIPEERFEKPLAMY